MTKLHITVRAEDPDSGFNRFVDAWSAAERGGQVSKETHINFEDLNTLLSVINTRRLDVLKMIRQQGPLCDQALATALHRNYRNVQTDTRVLEGAGLLTRSGSGDLQVLYDVIDARLDLD
ncbi:hypothetical protein GCM10022278_39740 [Allohahella marinimesophila]|uniref:Transcriptional regulator n=1 Tax=Allohahella marinimesophila TaxID=1054972 RepID=A0ABP7QB90_9GAMM